MQKKTILKKMSNVTSLTRQIEESVENVDSLLIVLNKLVGIQCPNLRSNHIVIIIIIIIIIVIVHLFLLSAIHLHR